MDIDKLMELYEKERSYQKKVFGDYKNNPALNIASFLNFIEIYLEKAKKSYSELWTFETKIPDWIDGCKELDSNPSAPIKTYEYLVKIMALAGAALEAYTEINPDLWRGPDQIKDKWKV